MLAAAFQSILFFFLIFLWFNFTSLWVANMCLLHQGLWTSCLLSSSSSSKEICTHHGTGWKITHCAVWTQTPQPSLLCIFARSSSSSSSSRLGAILSDTTVKVTQREDWRQENSHSGVSSCSYFRRLSDNCSFGLQRKEAIVLKLILMKITQFRLDLFFFLSQSWKKEAQAWPDDHTLCFHRTRSSL